MKKTITEGNSSCQTGGENAHTPDKQTASLFETFVRKDVRDQTIFDPQLKLPYDFLE